MFRLLAVFLLAPVLSIRGVPTQVKLGFAFCFTLALWPAQTGELPAPLPLLVYAGAVLRETLIGAMIGFVAYLITGAAQVAGSVMDLQVGFRASSIVNPLTSLPSSVLDQVYLLLASAVFLIVGGDHALITALSRTFRTLPAGTNIDLGSELGARLTALTSSALVAGVTIALPVLAITATIDIMLAILSRAVPQIQVFFIGIPIKFGVGLVALLIVLPGSLLVLRRLVADMPPQIAWLLNGL